MLVYPVCDFVVVLHLVEKRYLVPLVNRNNNHSCDNSNQVTELANYEKYVVCNHKTYVNFLSDSVRTENFFYLFRRAHRCLDKSQASADNL